MRNEKSKTIAYFQQPESAKRVTTLLKSGNLKKVSGKTQYAVNIRRNRILMVSIALVLIFIGLFSRFF